jgi:APA family basic amino acid/polyamine antiporter
MIVMFQNIAVVANVTNFSLLSTFAIINAAVIVLRYREPRAERPFKVPGSVAGVPVIPLLGVFSSLFMIPFVGRTAILAGSAFAIVGLVLYHIRQWRGAPPQRDS